MDGNKRSNPVTQAEKDAIRPGFLGRLFGGKNDTGTGNSDAASNLRKAEDGSGGIIEQAGKSSTGNSLAEARSDEEEPRGFYSGLGRSLGQKEDGKSDIKGNLVKGAPVVGILVIIFLFGFLAFTSTSSELVAWKENVFSMFGQGSAVISTRGNYFMSYLLRPRRTGEGLTNSGIQYNMPKSLAEKLSAERIHYVDDADGKGLKLLVYQDADGNNIPVVASKYDTERANDLAGKKIVINGEEIELSSSRTLADMKKNNSGFRVGYDTATEAFTGKTAGWYDNMTDALFTRIVGKKARNQMYSDGQEEDREKIKEETNKKLLGNASDGAENSDTYIKTKNEDGELIDVADDEASRIVNSDGRQETVKEVESKSGKISVDADNTDSSARVKNVEASLTARAQKVAMGSATVGCAFLRGIGSINTAVGAVMTKNVIDYASKYLELADKIKAGDADEVVNVALDNLNAQQKTTVTTVDGENIEVEGSVTESDGWNAPFATTNIIKEDDPSARMVNRESVSKIALKKAAGDGLLLDVVSSASSFGAGITAFKYCIGLQGVAGIIDGISDVVLILTTAGFGNALKEIFIGSLKGAALGAAVTAMTTIISLMTPSLSKWFASNLSDVFLGKTGGFSLLSGAQNIMNSNLQMSTGRYADEENAREVFALTKDVETEWAEYERATKSPLDVTSKYTFLGSIYNSLSPLINSSGKSVVSTASSIAKLTGSSAISLVSPTVKAANELNNLSFSSAENCSFLNSVGVSGDFACNKYTGAYVEDLTTVDHETIYKKMEEKDSFDGTDANGNPIVKKGSNYSKYIVACVASDTQPGTMNAAVHSFIENLFGDNVVTSSLLNYAANYIPVGGFIDTAEALQQGVVNFPWNSGMACTGKTGDNELDEEVRYYSAYNLDQRVLYDMGVIESNSTVSFLEDYYKENPLDYSFEGQIARISGMTKEEVNDTLGLIEYYQFLANYHPENRYAFGKPMLEEESVLRFDNDNKLAGNYFTLLNQISFADIRNRTFAV